MLWEVSCEDRAGLIAKQEDVRRSSLLAALLLGRFRLSCFEGLGGVWLTVGVVFAEPGKFGVCSLVDPVDMS